MDNFITYIQICINLLSVWIVYSYLLLLVPGYDEITARMMSNEETIIDHTNHWTTKRHLRSLRRRIVYISIVLRFQIHRFKHYYSSISKRHLTSHIISKNFTIPFYQNYTKFSKCWLYTTSHIFCVISEHFKRLWPHKTL